MVWGIIAAFVFAVDQLTKYIVAKNISYGKKIPVISNFFYLTYHENKGAAWGIFQNGRYFFIVLTLIASAFILYYLVKTKSKLLKVSLSLILGGAYGNLADRIIKGSVADFLDFYFGSFHFPTFNAADMFITIGTVVLAFYLLFIYREPVRKGGMEDRGNKA